MAALISFSRLFGIVTRNSFKRINPNFLSKQVSPAVQLWQPHVAGLRTKIPWIPTTKPADYQSEVRDTTEEDEKLTEDVINEINKQISTNVTGRLFAVVQICGKQFKITDNDLVIIEGYWAPNIGDCLRLEKVLLVGSTDFTLIGRPLLNRELVSVSATVIEKSLSHTKPHFKFVKRKQYRRLNFCRVQQTMLRINSIDITGQVNKLKDVQGLDRVY